MISFIIQLTSALDGNVVANPQEYGWENEDELNIGFFENFFFEGYQIPRHYVIPAYNQWREMVKIRVAGSEHYLQMDGL